MNEELTQSDLKAIHRAMSAADRMDRLRKVSRIGWTIALASAFGIVLLAFVLRQVQPSPAPLTIDNRSVCITCPQPSPSPEEAEDIRGTEPDALVVSAHPETTIEKIVAAAHLCGVAPGIAIRLAARESGLRHRDSRGRVLRSPAGAYGIFQVKHIAAREISPTLRVENEWENMLAGLCYLSKQKGTMRQKLYAYHSGPNRKRTSVGAVAYANTILEESAQ